MTANRVTADNYFCIIPEWVLYHEKLPPLAVRLYGVLARVADHKTLVGEATRSELAERLHVDVKTVDRAMKQLEDVGAVVVERGRFKGDMQLPNRYTVITARPLCTGDSDEPGDGGDAHTAGDARDTHVPDGGDMDGEAPRDTGGAQTESLSREESPPTPRRRGERTRGDGVRHDHVGTDKDAAFVAFWESYPRKVDKGHARRAWRKATIAKAVDPPLIVSASERFGRAMTDEDPQYVPHPATWLNGERWDDEIAAAAAGTRIRYT